jgi:hypothetical protein
MNSMPNFFGHCFLADTNAFLAICVSSLEWDYQSYRKQEVKLMYFTCYVVEREREDK